MADDYSASGRVSSADPTENQGTTDGASDNVEAEQHAARVQEVRIRASQALEEGRCVANYVTGKSNLIRKVGTITELANAGYKLDNPAEYGVVSQSLLANFSNLLEASKDKGKIKLLAHTLELSELRPAYRKQVCEEGLKLLRYFTSNTSVTSSSQGSVKKSSYFLRIYDIFLVDNDQQVVVLHERFVPDLSLWHKIRNGKWNGTYRTAHVKQWAIQIAEAIDVLNVAGVVHRFIRPENILLVQHRSVSQLTVKLASFDFACRFYHGERQTSAGLLGPRLPIALAPHLLDHLPPECFSPEGYEGSMIDVWSLGTVVVQLLTDHNPFEVPEEVALPPPRDPERSDASTDGNWAPDHLVRWRQCDERRMIPEEIRSLLDDVFRDADQRITVWEVAKDQRLWCGNNKEFVKLGLPAYYRIDLDKARNVDVPDPAVSGARTANQVVAVAQSTFLPESKTIFGATAYTKVDEEYNLQPEWTVLRDASFAGDLAPPNVLHDYYLKAVHNTGNASATAVTGSQVAPEPNCLVKIVSLHRIPMRHRNMLLNESTKIMRHLSDAESSVSGNVHRVWSVFQVSDALLYIFFEPLEGHQSVHQVISKAVASALPFPPPMQSSSAIGTIGAVLTLKHVQTWVHSLAEVVLWLHQLGLAHRYIRSEFVFVCVTEPTKIKLTHFDLSCFVWNPEKSFVVRRNRGLQDECEHQWDHLPPQCFELLYDALQVDPWSVGIVLATCITGKLAIFTVPMSQAQANEQWAVLKRVHSTLFHTASIGPTVTLLNVVFGPEDKRPRPAVLVERTTAAKLLCSSNQHPRSRQRPHSDELGSSVSGGGRRSAVVSRSRSGGKRKNSKSK